MPLTAPYTPPPAPLPHPAVPVAPPGPAPLSSADRFRHLAGCVGVWTVGGLLGYGTLRAFLAGWLEPCAATLGWVLAGLLLGVGALLLLPFYHEWQTVQLWHAQQYAHHALSQDDRLLQQAAYVAWVDKVLGKQAVTVDSGPEIYDMSGRRVVTSVSTPSVPTPARRVDDAVVAAAVTVDKALGRWVPPEEPQPPQSDGDTQRLPDYPALPAMAYQPPPSPPSPYTANMRALVDCALSTGTCTGAQGKALGIADRQHRAACDTLERAGVLTHANGLPWQLTERVKRLAQDNDERELHAWIHRRLVN